MNLKKMSFKALVLLLCTVMIFVGVMPASTASAAPAADATVGMAITPSAVTAGIAQEFTVSVQVTAGAQQVDTVQASLDFDPTYIKALAIIPGSAFATTLQNTFDNAAGTVDFAGGSLPPASPATGTFTLFQVKFQALVPTSGTNITFHAVAPRESGAFYQGTSVLNPGGLSLSTITVSDTGGGGVPTATPVAAPPGTATLNLNPPSRSAALNEQFTIAIQVNAGTQPVDSVQASLNFNPAYLKIIQLTPGTSLGTILQNQVNNVAGTIDFSAGALAPAIPPIGTFTLATLTVQALAPIAGTPITFSGSAPRATGIFYQGTSLYNPGSAVGSTIAISGSSTPVPQNPGPVYGWPWYYANFPTFSILSVVTDSNVTVQTYNFPANQTFTVRMGEYGTLGIGGIVVGTLNSGAGGSFQATFNIPDALKGRYQIAIRMDSSWGGYYAYNWFYNNTTGSGGQPGTYGIPTFSIVSVANDQSVTVQTSNFPANQTFTVRMGAYGSLGINGIVVGTTNSGSGGSFQATYTIPDALKGSYQIAIRMESNTGYYYAYNWFYNNTSGAGGIPGYVGIPSFSIVSVVKDQTVTIQTYNFPANTPFTVRMGGYGTLGIGGIIVGTTNSGAGGSFQATYTIPDALKGSYQIAIRMDSGYYYAYNWYYNN